MSLTRYVTVFGFAAAIGGFAYYYLKDNSEMNLLTSAMKMWKDLDTNGTFLLAFYLNHFFCRNYDL